MKRFLTRPSVLGLLAGGAWLGTVPHAPATPWQTVNPAADIDGNGRVELEDYFLLANNWNRGGDPE